MSEKKEKIGSEFMTAFKIGFNITKSIGHAVASGIKKVIDAKNYRDSIHQAITLPEPIRTQVILGIVGEWKKKPETQFVDDIINALSVVLEPPRRKELGDLMAFCAARKMAAAVRKIRSLL